ncbi:MAG: extracellular solute-binding protein [Candidatus Bathyarchaeia archaeon]
MSDSLSQKKVSRRKFLYLGAGIGAVAILGGFAAYTMLKAPPSKETIITAPTSSVGSISLYAEKGWYAAEDEARKWIARMFKRETGIDIQVTSLTQEDLLKKVVAGATAKSPPELAFCTTLSWLQEYCWNGWYEDLSEFVDILKELEVPQWMIDAWKWYDPTVGRLILAGVPVCTDNIPFHYWKDFLDEVGMPSEPDEIPMKFDEFTSFWREAQDKLWQKKPDLKEKVYGIGWPSLGGIGINPGDGWAQIAHLLVWHGWDPIKPQGFIIDSPENIEVMRTVVKWVMQQYQDGYMPKGILEWGSPDNNKAFHAKQIISVFNASMSIPLYWYSTDKDAYFKKSASLGRMPSPTGARGVNLWHTFGWYIFKDAKYKDLAKEFVKWFLQPEILNFYMKAAGGRMFPASRMVLEMDPYWEKGKEVIDGVKDPHLPTVYQRLIEGPNRPFIHQSVGYPIAIVDCPVLRACQKAIAGLSVDEAVKEAIEFWKERIRPYIEKIEQFKR